MTLSCSQKLSALLRGIRSKHAGDFYRLNYLVKPKFHKKACENKDFRALVMPSKDTKILEFTKSLITHIIYADLEYLIKRIDECKNNSEKISTAKVEEHIPSRYSVSTIRI